MENGRFITFEGIEGCGKTTQLTRLLDWLDGQGMACVRSKEPGGTPIGARIREILLHPAHHGMSPVCEALLYLADRAQHHQEIVKPALSQGRWVVCDRYHDSTLAYQGAARGLAREELNRIFQLATGGLKPDLTFLLDLDPKVGLERAWQRNKTQQLEHTEGRFEAEHLHFHQEVRRCFLEMVEQEPERFVVIDANRTPDLVADEIRMEIRKRWVNTFV